MSLMLQPLQLTATGSPPLPTPASASCELIAIISGPIILVGMLYDEHFLHGTWNTVRLHLYIVTEANAITSNYIIYSCLDQKGSYIGFYP